MGLLSKAATNNPSISQAEGNDSPPEPASPATDQAVLDALGRYGLQNPVYQGIVLGMPKDVDEDGLDEYFSQLSFMVASFGNTIRLPSDYALILFPAAKDRGLIAHRMAKTLRAVALVDFEATAPDQALSKIQSCL
jgi:hypothetical protein